MYTNLDEKRVSSAIPSQLHLPILTSPKVGYFNACVCGHQMGVEEATPLGYPPPADDPARSEPSEYARRQLL